MRRVAVVGSRSYRDMESVRQFVWEQERDTVIVSGGAIGVDSTAVSEAKRLHMPYEVYLPDWQKNGKAGGIFRNRTIVDKSDEVVAFWDGQSKGTKFTIDYAMQQKKQVQVIR